MAHILLSALLHPVGMFGEFLETLCADLEARGHRVTFWSPGPLRSEATRAAWLPLPWPLHQAVGKLAARGIGPRDAQGLIDDATWRVRLEMTGHQGIRRDEVGALYQSYRDICAGLIHDLKPDLFLAWNPLTVHTGVPHDLCRAWGIPVMAIERGIPSDTMIFERQGMFGQSALAGKTLESILAEADFAEAAARGRDHMDRYPLASMMRYEAGANADAARPGARAGLRIAVLGTDDCTVGMFPPDHPDRMANFPLVRSSEDAAAAVAMALPEAEVLVKSHPSALNLTPGWTLPPNAVLVDTAPDALLRDCDVIVSLGGSLVALALRLGKPVVALGRDFYSGKGITFDPPDRDAIAATITAAAAATPEDLANRLTRYHALCGKAMEDVLFAYPARPGGAQDMAALIGRIEALAQTAPNALPDLPEATTAGFRPGRADPAQVGAVINDLGSRELLLDFDHTLFADNSTEAYFRAARPAFLVSLLLFVLRDLPPWRRFGGRSWFRLRDFTAVVAISLLLPWNIWRWRRIAPGIFREKSTHPIAEMAARVPTEQTMIVSFGTDFIIRALLRGSHWEQARRIATPMPPPLRATMEGLGRGKTGLVSQRLSPRQIASAVLLTDSEDDRDLLDRVGIPLLVTPASHGTQVGPYLPLRYTADAKYNKQYLRRICLLIEIPLMALAFLTASPFGPGVLAGFLALYLSVQCIYEIGYFDNDQRAAMREANPTLKPRAQLWAQFPLERHAWVWGTVSGAIGCALITGAGIGISGIGTPGMAAFAAAFATWMAGMVALRFVFRFYNDRSTWMRTALYPALPFAKVFAPALVMPVALVGGAGLLAHVIAMWSTYIVYRSGGDKNFFYRDDMRIAAFLLIGSAMAVTGALAPTLPNALLFAAMLALVCLQRFMAPLRRGLVQGLRRILRR